MPKLKVLSGEKVVSILKRFDFSAARQRGSHIKLERVRNRNREVLTIPLHTELDKGTIRAIFMQASRYIPEAELRPYFYTK